MAITQIRGNTQIKDGSIQNLQIAADAAIALSKLEKAVISADGTTAFTAAQSMGGFKLTNVATPTAGTDAVNKNYVDGIAQGLDTKLSVKAATTAAGGNISLSGTQTIDGVALVAGDRVLVKNQTDAKENGIYVVAAGAWARAEDANNTPAAEVTSGMFTFVESGTVNASSGFVVASPNSATYTVAGVPAIELGVDNITFSQFSGAGQITAGEGLTKTGNTISTASSLAGSGLSYAAGVITNADKGSVAVGTHESTYNHSLLHSNALDHAAATAGDGITVTGQVVAAKVSDFAGTNLEDDGSNNLRIAAAAAGDGLTGGGASPLAVGGGDGITVSANGIAVAPGDFTGTGLEVNAGDIRIAAAAAGNGLTGGGGSALAVLSDTAATGTNAPVVTVASTGLSIAIDNSTITVVGGKLTSTAGTPTSLAGLGLGVDGTTLTVNAGAGLFLSGDNVAVGAAAGSGITVNADDIAVNPSDFTGTGLEVNGGDIRIAASAAGDGLTGGAGSALAVGAAAGSGITVNANDIAVAPADFTGSGLEVSGGDIRIAAAAAGSGLTGGAGSALSVVVDNTTIEINGSNQLQMKSVGDYLKIAKLITREPANGTIDGTNATFTLAATPVTGTECVYLNGLLMDAGAGNDYTIATNTITFASAPRSGDKVRVNYISQ